MATQTIARAYRPRVLARLAAGIADLAASAAARRHDRRAVYRMIAEREEARKSGIRA